MNRRELIKYILISLTVLTFCTLVFLRIINMLDFNRLLRALINLSYIPNHNFCSSFILNGIKYNQMIIILVAASLLIIYLIKKILHIKHFNIEKMSLLIVWIIMTLFQTTSQLNFNSTKSNYCRNNLLGDNYPPMIWYVYNFAKECRQILHSYHNAQLTTDIDTSKNPGMFFHRTLAYHLYPIDIRNFSDKPQDTIIVFAKENAYTYVPEDYTVILDMDNNLLAVKKYDK